MKHKTNTATRYAIEAIRPNGTAEIIGWTTRNTKGSLSKAIYNDLPVAYRAEALASIPESESPQVKKHGIRWAMVLSSGYTIRIGDTALEANGIAA